jgi:hypothetical protein
MPRIVHNDPPLFTPRRYLISFAHPLLCRPGVWICRQSCRRCQVPHVLLSGWLVMIWWYPWLVVRNETWTDFSAVREMGVAESVLQSCCGLDDRGVGFQFPGGIKDFVSSPERQERQLILLIRLSNGHRWSVSRSKAEACSLQPPPWNAEGSKLVVLYLHSPYGWMTCWLIGSWVVPRARFRSQVSPYGIFFCGQTGTEPDFYYGYSRVLFYDGVAFSNIWL